MISDIYIELPNKGEVKHVVYVLGKSEPVAEFFNMPDGEPYRPPVLRYSSEEIKPSLYCRFKKYISKLTGTDKKGVPRLRLCKTYYKIP